MKGPEKVKQCTETVYERSVKYDRLGILFFHHKKQDAESMVDVFSLMDDFENPSVLSKYS